MAAATAVDWVAGMELWSAGKSGVFWAEWKDLSKVGTTDADSVEKMVVSTAARRELWMVASMEQLPLVEKTVEKLV